MLLAADADHCRAPMFFINLIYIIHNIIFYVIIIILRVLSLLLIYGPSRTRLLASYFRDAWRINNIIIII